MIAVDVTTEPSPSNSTSSTIKVFSNLLFQTLTYFTLKLVYDVLVLTISKILGTNSTLVSVAFGSI